MDAAKIQAKVYAGYAKAAARIGVACAIYRGSNIASAALVATTKASFSGAGLQGSRTGFNYEASLAANEVLVHALIDGSLVQPGDYLVTPSATYFVGSMDPILPILCVKCLHVVSIRRPRAGGARPVGLQVAYSGVKRDDEDQIAADLPASIQYAAQARAKGAELPADTQNRTDWNILVSKRACPLGSIQDRDIVEDNLRNRYQVIAAAWGALGYRLRCELLEA